MSRKCELSGKRPLFGNAVSHSHKKTRRKWTPNIQTKKFFNEVTGEWVTLKVCSKIIKTIDKNGLNAVLKKYGRV